MTTYAMKPQKIFQLRHSFACSSSSEKLHSEKLGRENYRNTARIFTPELLSKLPAKSFLFHKDINCEMD